MTVFVIAFYFPLFYLQLDALTHGLSQPFSFYSVCDSCSFIPLHSSFGPARDYERKQLCRPPFPRLLCPEARRREYDFSVDACLHCADIWDDRAR